MHDRTNISDGAVKTDDDRTHLSEAQAQILKSFRYEEKLFSLLRL